MRRLFLSLATAGLLGGALVMPAAAAHGGEPQVVVMQHLCKADIQSEADFKAIEDKGAGGQPGGQGTLPGLVATVLACPAVNLTKDTPTAGIHADPSNFDYKIAGSGGESYTLAADGMFMPAKLCEADIKLDVDGDGDMDKTTCLDVSMYGFSPLTEGQVTITQSPPVANTRFGTIRFTPASTDEKTKVSAGNGVIVLDTGKDTKVASPPLPLAEYNDDVVVVHVYNFQSSMPNAAMAQPTKPNSLPLLLGGLGLSLIGGAATIRRRAVRISR